jgi:hypothetical protein
LNKNVSNLCFLRCLCGELLEWVCGRRLRYLESVAHAPLHATRRNLSAQSAATTIR